MQIGRTAVIVHGAFVALGLITAGVFFAAEARHRGRRDPRLWFLVAGALAGGAIVERVGTLLRDIDADAGRAQQLVLSTRSILSGLAGAYLGVLVAKRLCRYEAHTGDLFAPAVAAGMAVGRVGCLLTELPGTPTGQRWGITLTAAQAAAIPGARAGIPLHPSFAYEIAFHLIALALLLRYRDRITAPDALFTAYICGYAVFRFLVEFVRGNQIAYAGLTRPQLFLLACSPLLIMRARRVVRAREVRTA